MEHDWILDSKYAPVPDTGHTKRWLCMNCYCKKYEWVGIKDGKFQKFYYIMDYNTQFDLNHKCRRLFSYE